METKIYTPVIVPNINLFGLALESADKGEMAKIAVRKFITSIEPNFTTTLNNLIAILTNIGNLPATLNKLLVIIKPDLSAYIYFDFPIQMEVKTTRSIKQNESVGLGDFADINLISFNDTYVDLNPVKGDQIVWLFRHNWHFGLYFDFTRELEQRSILEDLGYSHKNLIYQELFLFKSNDSSFNDLMIDGWFPFIRLLNGLFDNLITYYKEDKKHFHHIEQIVTYFDDKNIEQIVDRWWKNPILNSKRQIINSGIEAYLSKTENGYINCIKNLISEIEGIIRISYFQDTGNKEATIKQLKEYVVNSGNKQFNNLTNLGFTTDFMRYLSQSIFIGFDLSTPNIPPSRHSVSHGVAGIEIYTQVRALQLILTIDQIVFFLGNKPMSP